MFTLSHIFNKKGTNLNSGLFKISIFQISISKFQHWFNFNHLSTAANTAFIAAIACRDNINGNKYCSFVEQQIHYMLGSSGRSFVVGFGNNPPQRPHHRSRFASLFVCFYDKKKSIQSHTIMY